MDHMQNLNSYVTDNDAYKYPRILLLAQRGYPCRTYCRSEDGWIPKRVKGKWFAEVPGGDLMDHAFLTLTSAAMEITAMTAAKIPKTQAATGDEVLDAPESMIPSGASAT